MIDTTHVHDKQGRIRTGAAHADVVSRCPICSPFRKPLGADRERILDRLALRLSVLDAIDAMRSGDLIQLPATEDTDRFVADRVARF